MGDIVNYALKRSIISQMLNEAIAKKSVPVISLGSKDGSVNTDVKLKFSDEPDKEIVGKVQLSTTDYKKLLEGKAKLQSYTFIIESAGEKKTIILSGDEVNEGGFVHLVMGKPYTILSIKDTGGEDGISGEDGLSGEGKEGLFNDMAGFFKFTHNNKKMADPDAFNKNEQYLDNDYDLFITETEGDKKIIFTEIGVTEEDIEDSAKDFADENDLDEENPDVEIDPEEIKRLGFLYYGRGANFLFQNTSIFRWRDITSLGLGKGGFEKKTDKMKEKYGIYGSLTDKDFSMDMGADSYNIVFSDDLTYRKDGKEIIRLYKGKKYKFNYFKDKKSIVHRTSKKDKYPEITIYIRMPEDPKVAGENEQPKEYVENVLEIRPSTGSVFEIKPGDLKTKFKVVGTNIEDKK